MELIYLYMDRAYGEEYDLHLNFSQHTHIYYDKQSKKFSVNEKQTTLPKNFFGENIINVSAIFGKNGTGKSTIIDRLAFSGQSVNQDTNKYLIIYKDNDCYFIEGNIDDALLKPVGKRYFDKGKIDNKFINTLFTDGNYYSKLRYLKINSLAPCGARNMFMRLYSRQGNKKAIFDFLASKKAKIFFDISRKNTLRINFTDHDYIPFLGDVKTKGDLLSFIKEVSPNVFRILDISLARNRFKRFNSKNLTEEVLSEKEQFILSVYQVFYQTILLYIYAWLYEDSNTLSKEDEKIYQKNLTIVNDSVSDFNDLEWFKDPNQLDERLKRILSRNLTYGVKQSLGEYFNAENIYKSFSEVISKLKKFKDIWFKKNNWLHIDIDSLLDSEIDTISSLLGKLIELEYENGDIGEFSTCIFGEFSSGEEYLTQIFAQLHSQIVDQTNLTYVLLLDEYELHLHPEWARRFLYYLLNFLKKYSYTKFQLILTSHSPYLVSDLPKENILLLQFNESSKKREICTPQKSFASNYYDLLKNNFFLNDTVGEFAKYKINECISQLSQIDNKIKNALSSDDGLKEVNEILLDDLMKIEKTIKLIDDDFIRCKLQDIVTMLNSELISLVEDNNMVEEYLLRKELKELEDRCLALRKKLGKKHD